jgi:hypothetical protein
MLKILYLIVSVAIFLGGAWASEDWSDKPIIDEQFREVEIAIKEVTTNCRKNEKNVIKRLKCGDSAWKKYEKEGELRGTEEYCRKHYGRLNFDELYKIWKNLKQQRSLARINPEDDVPGEVTEVMFRIEEHWVESRLAQLQKERTAVIEKAVFNKTEQGRAQ